MSEERAHALYKHASKEHGVEARRKLNGYGLAAATGDNVAKAFAKLAPAPADADFQELAAPSGEWMPSADSVLLAASRLKGGKGHDVGGWSHETVQNYLTTAVRRLPFAPWLANLSIETYPFRCQLWSAHTPCDAQ